MSDKQNRVTILADKAVEGELSAADSRALKNLLENDVELLDDYIDFVFGHASLSCHAEELRKKMEGDRPVAGRERPTNRSSIPWKIRIRLAWITTAIFAALLAVVFTALALWEKDDLHFATIMQTTNCLWSDSSTKTNPGSRLGPSILRLEQGIVQIHFDCGVNVTLEGPCVFEVIREKETKLRSGRLVASIESPSGKGFLVDTNEALVKDLGTKFGIHAPIDEPAVVHVIDGSVEIHPHKSKQPLLLEKGNTAMVGNTGENGDSTAPQSDSLSVLQISSAMGKGKESWVVRGTDVPQAARYYFPKGNHHNYMFVKTSFEPVSDRKAIFSIDLSSLTKKEKTSFSDTTLCLSYGPTEIGYASNVPNSDFTVFGLKDESHDSWSPSTLNWDSFPGSEVGTRLSTNVWRNLGTFSIQQGVRTGTAHIRGDELDRFIREDTNGIVTFAIVRETFATDVDGLVHGFANRFHETLMPPRLIFRFRKDEPLSE